MRSLISKLANAARFCSAAYGRGLTAAVRWVTQDSAKPNGITVFHPLWLSNRAHRAALMEAADMVEGTVLDVGCGAKPWQHLFARAEEYIGCDYLGPSATTGAASCVDVRADAAMLPFADASFDSIVSTQCLEHVWDGPGTIAEMHRILRPGGAVVLTTPFAYRIHDSVHDYVRYTAHGLHRLFDSAGFAEMDVRPVGGLYLTLSKAVAVHLFYEVGTVTPQARRSRKVAISRLSAAIVRPLVLPFFAVGNILGALGQALRPRMDTSINTFPPTYIVTARKADVSDQDADRAADHPSQPLPLESLTVANAREDIGVDGTGVRSDEEIHSTPAE